jgi:hypothetical protein
MKRKVNLPLIAFDKTWHGKTNRVKEEATHLSPKKNPGFSIEGRPVFKFKYLRLVLFYIKSYICIWKFVNQIKKPISYTIELSVLLWAFLVSNTHLMKKKTFTPSSLFS